MSQRPSARGAIDREFPDHVVWRRRSLERAGFPTPLADALARDTRCDLHELLKLVDDGCQPQLAARILAPIDAPGTDAA